MSEESSTSFPLSWPFTGIWPHYMLLATLVACFVNISLLRVIFKAPSPIYPEYDSLHCYQTVTALIQLALMVVLCPRTLFVDDYFAVSIDGPARDFKHISQVVCFAVLVGLATNNAISTATSFGYRLWVILGKKATRLQMRVLLTICFMIFVVTFTILICTEDYSSSSPEATLDIGYKLATWKGVYILGVTVLCPVIVLSLAIGKASALLFSLTRITYKEAKSKHRIVLKTMLYECIIPTITLIAVLVWCIGYNKCFELHQFFECILFGIGPLILFLQALIPLIMTELYRDSYNPDFWTMMGFCDFMYAGIVAIFYWFLKKKQQ